MVKSTEQIIQELRNLFSFSKNDPRILGIILYGSYARHEQSDRSDIDVCIVAPNQDLYSIYQSIIQRMTIDIEKLDIRFFEELPLLIRGDVIEQGIVIFTADMGELTEYYFFSTRKELEDHRYMIKHLI